jgi:hypothetical protein
MMRFTVINKSGQELAIRLITNDNSRFYYLRVPEGDKKQPSQTEFTLVKDIYRIRVIYIVRKDPLTGLECPGSRSATIMALRDIRMAVTSCRTLPPNAGEPSMVKFGRWRCIR